MPILQKKMKDSDWSFEELQSKAQWELNWIEDDIFQRFVKNNPDIMLMYGKEASNRKQEIDRQHHTIPNQRKQRPKDKHCGNVHNRLWNHG